MGRGATGALARPTSAADSDAVEVLITVESRGSVRSGVAVRRSNKALALSGALGGPSC